MSKQLKQHIIISIIYILCIWFIFGNQYPSIEDRVVIVAFFALCNIIVAIINIDFQ